MWTRISAAIAVAWVIGIAGCTQRADNSASESAAAPPPGAPAQTAPPKGGIPIPPAVRDNLGITFATVERRVVGETRRVPGQFELRPEARREYRALLGGRVTLSAEQFQPVAPGDLLATLDSPQWRHIQHEAVEAEGEISIARAQLDVVRAQRAEAASLLAHHEQRIRELAAANTRKAELDAAAAALRVSLPRLDAEFRAQEAAVREAIEHYGSRLNALASVTGMSVDELLLPQGEHPAWRAITSLHVRAADHGIVEALGIANGGWLAEGALILTTVDPKAIRFHAEAPQADIALFHDDQRAAIVPPQGNSIALQDAMRGTIRVGLTAHAEARTISLYVQPDNLASWAKSGVSGFLEVAFGGEAQEQWAIPY